MVVGFLPLSGAATGNPDPGVAEVRDCMAGNFVERGALRELEVVSRETSDPAHTLKINMYWARAADGRARVTLHVMDPEELAGAAYLVREATGEDEVYVYVPEAKSVKRVTGRGVSQPLWGTDFSYSDIKYVQDLLPGGSTTRKPDASVLQRDVYVLETKTNADSVGFQKVVSYVDKESCTLLKAEFFDDGEVPKKVLEGDPSHLIQTDVYTKQVWLLLKYTMRDDRANTSSTVRLSEIYLLEEVPSATFAPETFFRPIKTRH